MEELIILYLKEIGQVFSLNGISSSIHNGCKYEVVRGKKYELIISNEIGSKNYRVLIRFLKSKKVFYIDLLMRLDEYKTQDINIPLSSQMDYLKRRKTEIVKEIWCEKVMNSYEYNQDDFIEKLNKLQTK